MSQPPPDPTGPPVPPSDQPGGWPSQGGEPPQQGYPGQPPQQGYPGHPPQGAGYPPQGGYPPQQGGYPPQQGDYPPQQGYGPEGGYPSQSGYPQQPGYPPQPWAQPGQPQGGAPVSESDEKLWATLSHISIPFLGFVGPLVVYLVYKDRSVWLKENAVEALNFSILYTIAQVVCSILTVVVIGAVLLPLVFVGGLVLCILAAMAANRHEFYRYPLNWRLVT